MFEKVNPLHPDKIADRIAGAIVDLAYSKSDNPKIAVEVLIGHGECSIIVETSERIYYEEVREIVDRISPSPVELYLNVVPQDIHLADNQEEISCGDNGIFKGVPVSEEEERLSSLAHKIYEKFPYDGKYIIVGDEVIICQSNAENKDIENLLKENNFTKYKINPIGYWTGGSDVDSGATNRKLGSDMARSVTGGGLHGKDGKTKADVCCNIWAFKRAQGTGEEVQLYCAIGDKDVTCYTGTEKESIPFKEISDFGHNYIMSIGGYEKFAEWGLV